MQNFAFWSFPFNIWTFKRLRVWIPLRRGVLNATLCDKVCQWLAAGRWFSPGIPVSSINTTDHHNITEILLKVALNTITLTPNQVERFCSVRMNCQIQYEMLSSIKINTVQNGFRFYFILLENKNSSLLSPFYPVDMSCHYRPDLTILNKWPLFLCCNFPFVTVEYKFDYLKLLRRVFIILKKYVSGKLWFFWG